MLAKTAHGITAGHFADVGYLPFLPPLILGTSQHLSHYVGGKVEVVDPRIQTLGDGYELVIDSDKSLIIVNFKILNGRSPTYSVISGRVTDWELLMTSFYHISQYDKKEYSHGIRTRYMFIHEWLIWIVSAIRQCTRPYFSNFESIWPLLNGYSYEAYALPESYYLLIIKNTPNETPAGPDTAVKIPHSGHPIVRPNKEDLPAWDQWCRTNFSMSDQQWIFLLPVRDSQKSHGVNKDLELFSTEEKQFLADQLNFLIGSQIKSLCSTTRRLT